MYTLKTLSEINQRFLSAHYELLQTDVNKANKCIELIEKSRTTEKPMRGDIVRYTTENGEYYAHAFIESIQDGQAYIAEQSSVYACANEEFEDGFSCQVSAGGAFHYIPVDHMVYIGTEEKRFWHFGHYGGCADGGIDFYATVNVWECNLNKGRYSTKTHNKYYIYYDPEPEKRKSPYHFTTNGKAWKTETDFQAWLRTFRGIVEPGNWKNQLIVWTYKNVKHHCSPEEYEDLNAPEDTFLMNGSIRRCKRIYDDKNFIVHTYYVWYWDDPEKDFYERATEQNAIIKSYEFDWRKHRKENEYAREELKRGMAHPTELKLEV